MSTPLVTVTLNPCIDKTFSVQRVVPEHKLEATDVRRYPGGGGINVARAAERLGADALALWSGGGFTADRLERLLAKEDVPNRRLPMRAETRENVIVYEESSGQQYRFGMPGARLGDEERARWQQQLRQLEPCYLIVSGSLPPGATAQWYAELLGQVSSETRVVVDTKKEALVRALEVGVYLIKPNIGELSDITGRELSDDDDVEAAARDIVERRGAEIVLVSLGRGGAMLVADGVTERLSAPTVRPRSKVGAGDSMVGGLMVSLARGWPLAEAAAFGVAAGAAAVMTEGTELCRRDDTERLYRAMQRQRAIA